MATNTERNQALQYIVTKPTPGFQMMDVQVFWRTTILAARPSRSSTRFAAPPLF
jgi:hypothetical protein